ncbi:snare associated Golgi protein family domain-containing protein [Cyclospora cayetanensis]|uniref:Snare associated Golgi protein family domain-containing protein n=1 Tax=Cyclospora cayetanensis TaxID=88456 RepID=A0A1D3D573_9EIME|nr:snare associated Golgi protein family domain-containing protein [Cyclospora cayetanensis]
MGPRQRGGGNSQVAPLSKDGLEPLDVETAPATPERRRVIFLKFGIMAVLFVSALGCLALLYFNLPGLTGEARAELEASLPASFSELGRLRELTTLRKICAAVAVYRQQHPVALALLLSYFYLLYQSFPLFMFPFSGIVVGASLGR